MPNRTEIVSALYTRQQVARLTGLDDSTLNYWMREGVLRPSAGGVGKGQHRQFPYHQINLALLLNELKQFGVSLPELKRLAKRFHDAIDTFERLGITRINDEPLSSILYIRRQIEKKGSFTKSILNKDLQRYVEFFPWIEGRKLSREYAHLAWNLEVTFEEAVDVLRQVHKVFQRDSDRSERFPDRLVNLATTLDLTEYDDAYRYWSPITNVEIKQSDDLNYYSAHYLYRNLNREWEITRGDPDPSLTSYVGIKLEMLSANAWNKA